MRVLVMHRVLRFVFGAGSIPRPSNALGERWPSTLTAHSI